MPLGQAPDSCNKFSPPNASGCSLQVAVSFQTSQRNDYVREELAQEKTKTGFHFSKLGEINCNARKESDFYL